jgi:DNA-binding NarL/FixJ family response regulator
MPIRVIIADDSYLMREAIERVLARAPEVELIGVYDRGDTLVAAVERDLPDVVVIDVRMPPSGDDEGIRVARSLRRRHPGIGVVVLSQYAEPRYGIGLLQDGAEGRAYLLKEHISDGEELATAIAVVARGGSVMDPGMVGLLMRSGSARSALAQLTAREREVLSHMATGKSNGAIAASLVLSKRAVEKHVGAIFMKLGLVDEEEVSRRVSAVLAYLSEPGEDGRL